EQRWKEEAIHNLCNSYVKLAPSKVEGVGVFALRDIPEGAVVMRWDWYRYASTSIESEELKRRVPSEVYDQLKHIWHVDRGDNVITPLDFTATVSYVNFLNHADEPNLRYWDSDNTYTAARDICCGEELCINYNLDYYPGYTKLF
ncbi:unnamed protein product, partial [Choristocarpus tenellus]